MYHVYTHFVVSPYSPHPYLFFNRDGNSITFVGFRIAEDSGDLLDTSGAGHVLQRKIMSIQLLNALRVNFVDLSEDCRQWSKDLILLKLARVMGIEPHDPDPTYALTADNLIKMLAIYMRLRYNRSVHEMNVCKYVCIFFACRCGIPVVIMGETGCGKTRLIQYMCKLTLNKKDTRNMLVMKVCDFCRYT